MSSEVGDFRQFPIFPKGKRGVSSFLSETQWQLQAAAPSFLRSPVISSTRSPAEEAHASLLPWISGLASGRLAPRARSLLPTPQTGRRKGSGKKGEASAPHRHAGFSQGLVQTFWRRRGTRRWRPGAQTYTACCPLPESQALLFLVTGLLRTELCQTSSSPLSSFLFARMPACATGLTALAAA